jgi:hypothetical protein
VRLSSNASVVRVTVFAVLAMLAACNNAGNPWVIRDTTGATFDFVCGTDGCDARAHTGTPAPRCGDSYNYFAVRLVTMCEANSGSGFWVAVVGSCRPIACNADKECPHFGNSRQFTCIDGLCQDAGQQVSNTDVEALCLNTTPRSNDCSAAFTDPSVMESLALADGACSPTGDASECKVPDACPQL